MEDIYKGTINFKERIHAFEMAETTMRMVGFNPSGNYTIDDLMKLEDFLEKKYPVENYFKELVLPVGYYYGKTIIKNMEGSYWEGDGNDPFGLHINLIKTKEQTIAISPFVRANKFLKNREDGLSCFFEMMVFLMNGGMEKMQDVEYLKKVADKDGWVNFPDTKNSKGFKIRVSAILSVNKN